MGKLPGREGPLVVIREPQRLLRGACERRVALPSCRRGESMSPRRGADVIALR